MLMMMMRCACPRGSEGALLISRAGEGKSEEGGK